MAGILKVENEGKLETTFLIKQKEKCINGISARSIPSGVVVFKRGNTIIIYPGQRIQLSKGVTVYGVNSDIVESLIIKSNNVRNNIH